MEDAQGRIVDYLRLSLTDNCNYRCRYCMPPESKPNTLLPLDRCIELARAAVSIGVKKIRLTGGEPTLHPDLIELCRQLKKIPGLQELCLTTNGSLLRELAAPLKNAGLDRVNVSLDTLRPDRFQKMTYSGKLSDVLEGIQALEDVQLAPIKLDVVLIGGFNEDEVQDFVDLTLEHPWEIRFIELMPMGLCSKWPAHAFLSSQFILDQCPKLEALPSEGVARRFHLPGAQGTLGLISPLSHSFCSQCRRIRITCEGSLKACLHSREETDLNGLEGKALEAMLRTCILGKPMEHHLQERPSDSPRTMNRIGG